MTRPVAIPLRFGSRRFGKISGGKLDSDGLDYPQPHCGNYWDGGTTFMVQPAWTDAAIEEYGFKQNALISGGRQDVYGKPIRGWLYADAAHTKTWLIQPNLAGAATSFDNSLSISFDIVQFGVYDGDGARRKTTVTKSLAQWGQGNTQPAISYAWFSSCANLTLTSADLYLVSAKKDGSVAVIMVAVPCEEEVGYAFSSFPYLRQWPIGFIGVSCASDPDGGMPTLSLSVLRDRATTLGTRSGTTVSGGLVGRTLCEDSYVVVTDVWEGEESFSQGVSGEILALFYENDVLTEMTIDCSIVGTAECDTAEYFGDNEFGHAIYKQHSVGETTISWTLTAGAVSASWAYVVSEDMNATLICGTGNYWTSTRAETLSDGVVVLEEYSANLSGSDYVSIPRTMPNAQPNSGAYSFTLHGACRSAGDLWLDGFWFENSVWHSMEIVRYAYNVIGLQARTYDEDDNYTLVRGPALSPGGKIAVENVGDGDYGAYNARTKLAVAGTTTTVSYV